MPVKNLTLHISLFLPLNQKLLKYSTTNTHLLMTEENVIQCMTREINISQTNAIAQTQKACILPQCCNIRFSFTEI